MKIEKASVDDLDHIQKLYLMLLEKEKKEYDSSVNLKWATSKLSARYFKESISSKDACVLVAWDDGKIIGYLDGWLIKPPLYRTMKKQAELGTMFILGKYRNMKIGRKLVKRFLKWTKDNGASNAIVRVSVPNNNAIGLYRNCGFLDHDLILETKK
jgi:GNAT superfamily N-acetyltransferase